MHPRRHIRRGLAVCGALAACAVTTPVAAGAAGSVTFRGGYRTVAAHEQHLRDVAAARPDLAVVRDIGDSWRKATGLGGHDILAVCITHVRPGDCALTPAAPKPRLLVHAGIHGAEIAGPEIAWRWIDALVEGDATDPQVAALLDRIEVWVVPVVNPDGHEVVEAADGAVPQRKNGDTSLSACATPATLSSQAGVDLNRNFAWNWGTAGASSAPCALYFHGSAPASAPETRALSALATALYADRRGPARSDAAPADTTGVTVGYHASLATVMYPWSDTTGAAPNATALRSLATRMAAPSGYRVGQTAAVVGATTGDADAEFYGRLGVAAVTVEMGASGACDGWMPTYTCVDARFWPAERTGLMAAAQAVRAPYGPPPPANDTFSAPTALSGAAGAVSATTVGATAEWGEPVHAGRRGGSSVWFTWTAPTTGTYVFDTAGATLDTMLGVYTGTAVDRLTPRAANDDAATGDRTSLLRLDAVAGTTYRIALDAADAAQGVVTLRWAAPPPPPPPPGANLLANPSFEAALTGWTGWTAGLTRVAAPSAPEGVWAARLARIANGNYSLAQTGAGVRTAAVGTRYAATAYVAAGGAQSTGRTVSIRVRERTAAGATVADVASAPVRLTAAFQPVGLVYPARRAGSLLDVIVTQYGAVAGDAMLVDAVSLITP